MFKKSKVLILYFLFLLSFGYLSVSEFVSGGKFGWLMGAWFLLTVYQLIHLLIQGKKDGWKSKEIMVDNRIKNITLFSLSISHIYILFFLIVGVIGLSNEFIAISQSYYISLAILTSGLIFVISQIVQLIIK